MRNFKRRAALTWLFLSMVGAAELGVLCGKVYSKTPAPAHTPFSVTKQKISQFELETSSASDGITTLINGIVNDHHLNPEDRTRLTVHLLVSRGYLIKPDRLRKIYFEQNLTRMKKFNPVMYSHYMIYVAGYIDNPKLWETLGLMKGKSGIVAIQSPEILHSCFDSNGTALSHKNCAARIREYKNQVWSARMKIPDSYFNYNKIKEGIGRARRYEQWIY